MIKQTSLEELREMSDRNEKPDGMIFLSKRDHDFLIWLREMDAANHS